ncbi:unnamed protein product [Scytosiphon promiscuus]
MRPMPDVLRDLPLPSLPTVQREVELSCYLEYSLCGLVVWTEKLCIASDASVAPRAMAFERRRLIARVRVSAALVLRSIFFCDTPVSGGAAGPLYPGEGSVSRWRQDLTKTASSFCGIAFTLER